MKFKLSHSEFSTLLELFRGLNDKDAANEFWQKLLHVIATNIYLKLYNMAPIRKDKYTLKLTVEESLGFYLLTNEHKFDDSSQVGNLLNCMNMLIHQKYS